LGGGGVSRPSQGQKRLLLAAAHVVVCVFYLWAFYPRPTSDNLQVIEGVPVLYKGGGRLSSTSFKVGEILMSCRPSALGPTNSCRTNFLPTKQVKATYFRMPTVFSILGGGQGTAILTKLEQKNELILLNTEDDLSSSYQWGSVVEIMLFVLSYFSFIKLKFFKR
jgi:hypothetical protein